VLRCAVQSCAVLCCTVLQGYPCILADGADTHLTLRDKDGQEGCTMRDSNVQCPGGVAVLFCVAAVYIFRLCCSYAQLCCAAVAHVCCSLLHLSLCCDVMCCAAAIYNITCAVLCCAVLQLSITSPALCCAVLCCAAAIYNITCAVLCCAEQGDPGCFGCAFGFCLGDTVTEGHEDSDGSLEYLVFFNTITKLAEAQGMRLVGALSRAHLNPKCALPRVHLNPKCALPRVHLNPKCALPRVHLNPKCALPRVHLNP
jgi:hypothetical protein